MTAAGKGRQKSIPETLQKIYIAGYILCEDEG